MHAKKAPADALELLRWTLQNIDDFFRAVDCKKVWIHRDAAVHCVRACQNFTVFCLHFEMVHASS